MEQQYGNITHFHGNWNIHTLWSGKLGSQSNAGYKHFVSDITSGLDLAAFKRFYVKFGKYIKFEYRESYDLAKRSLGRGVYWEAKDGSFGNATMNEGEFNANFAAPTEERFQELYTFFSEFPEVEHDDEPADDNKGQVFVMTVSIRGFEISELGYAAVPIEWGNYAQQVQDQMKAGIADLSTDTPRGRMLLLEGEPGTGKTFLLRGLVNSVENAPFVIVPSSAVAKLGDPQFMNFMLRFKNENEFEGPLVLMLEDADKCLVKREDTDLSGISSILNLSDGILGEMMDIRIVATTNAATVDFDPAILRKGRLSQHIKVGKLSAEEGNAVFDRLMAGKAKGDFAQPLKLGEVYDAAYSAGWRPPNKKEREDTEAQRRQKVLEKLRKPSILQQYYGMTANPDGEKAAEAVSKAYENLDKKKMLRKRLEGDQGVVPGE